MGIYLNPKNETKEQFLKREGTEFPINIGRQMEFIAFVQMGFVPVVLVSNEDFTACGITYCQEEFNTFLSDRDTRKRIMYLVPIAVIEKEVPGREYCLSKLGNPFYRTKPEHIRKPYLHMKLKHRVIILTDENSNKKRFKVARLVALEFIPNPNNLSDVIHLKEKKDDRVINLKWGNDFDSGTISTDLGNRISRKILCVETGIIYRNANEIKRILGLDNSAIHRACKGEYTQSYGFKWEYVN